MMAEDKTVYGVKLKRFDGKVQSYKRRPNLPSHAPASYCFLFLRYFTTVQTMRAMNRIVNGTL